MLFLCECRKHNQYVEHKDMLGCYTLWIVEGGKHVVFVDLSIILQTPYLQTNFECLIKNDMKSEEESCKMISRKFIQILGYRPDYIVVVNNKNASPSLQLPSIDPQISTCGMSMSAITSMAAVNPTLHHIRTLAEGPGEPCGKKNSIGLNLTSLLKRLDEKGIFKDPKYFDQQPKSIFIH